MSSEVISKRSVEGAVERSLPGGRLKFWPVLTLPLSALVAWAINSGGEALRWVGLGAVAWSLAIPMLVSLEAGLFAMMLFEPLRGFLRRAQYLFLPYSQSDPIHVITPLITCMAFVLLLQRRRLGMFTQTKQAKLVSILCLIYFLQIFNPLQGGLSIGLTGALFILVPVAWFYFGQEIKPEFIHTLLRAIVIIGLITSVYGLYHLVYGFPSFEQYWLDHTDAYESISLGRIKRALATFSSAEEWGRYLEVGAIIAFGLVGGAAGYLKKAGWFLSGAALTAMLMLTGQRTALFGLVLGIVVLLVAGAKTWQGVLVRLMLTLAPVILVVVLVNAPTTDDMISLSEEERFGIVLSHTTRGALNPTQEGSLQERITIWTYLATEIIPNNPLGMGLGATSLLAARHEGSDALPPTDSYVIGSVITCGLPTALLFIWILLRSSWVSWRSVGRETNGTVDGNVWRILAALMPALILNSFFGNTFTLYSVAPIGWLLVGWISAQELSRSKTREPFYL